MSLTQGEQIGHYTIQSIRSRVTGSEKLLEISESGTSVADSAGGEHLLIVRGALLLGDSGVCRMILAVSVDGDDPGISDRHCIWSVDGDQFVLGGESGLRTVYRVKRDEGELILEGIVDVGPDGRVVADASAERIVSTIKQFHSGVTPPK